MKYVLAFLLSSTIAAQAGSITISITTNSPQSGVAAGTITHTETFSDAGLVAHLGQWLVNNLSYCNLGGTGGPGQPPPAPCTLTGANLNNAFQAWAAQFIQSTKDGVLSSERAAAGSAASSAVGPVN